MAKTPLPRVYVSLDLPVRSVMERIGKAWGCPASTAVSRFLLEALPGLEGIARSLEMARSQRVEALDHLAGTLAGAQAMAQQAQLGIWQEKVKIRRKAARRGKRHA